VLCLPICQCPSCFSKSGAMHTSSFGPTHVVRQHGLNAVPPSIAVTPPVAEVPADSQARRTSPAVDAEPNQCQPVVHRNVACDNCKKTVVGIRRKCLDCPGKVMIMHHNTGSSYISRQTMIYARPVLSRVPQSDTILSMNSLTLKRPDGYLFTRSLVEMENVLLLQPRVLRSVAGLAPLRRLRPV